MGKRRGQRRVTAGRKPRKPSRAGRGTRPSSRRPISRPKSVKLAVKVLGKKRIKSGPVSLGKTPFRGLSSRGYNALREKLKSVRSARSKDLKRFTYSVTIRKPDGTFHDAAQRQFIPEKRMADVRYLMRPHVERRHGKRIKVAGYSETEAVRSVLVREVQRFIHHSIGTTEGGYTPMGDLRIALKSATPALLKKMQRQHRTQGYTYSVEFHAEV